MSIVKEAARHILRRPVVGVAAAARTTDGRWLLIRRADTGTWALPGGTLEWGETVGAALRRELREECGVVEFHNVSVLGVYSHPDRDPRFHAVTILVVCELGHAESHDLRATNPLEIRDVKLFRVSDIPWPLAMKMDDMLRAAMDGDRVLE